MGPRPEFCGREGGGNVVVLAVAVAVTFCHLEDFGGDCI